MVVALVIAAIVIACAALTVAAARIATRNPALEAQIREAEAQIRERRAENARLSGLVAAIHKRARAGADVNPELQVVCDLIEGARDRNVIEKGL